MPEGVHSAGSQPADMRAALAKSGCGSFMSLRFGPEHQVLPMAVTLRDALAARGSESKLINMAAGGDIDTEVFKGIEECPVFIVFGSKHYGEDTGNQACTYYEYKHAFSLKKRIVLLRLIPFDQEFAELQGRVVFGANKLVIPWLVGTPMPPDLPDKILEVVRAETMKFAPGREGAVPEPEPAALGQPPKGASPKPTAGIRTLADFAEAVDDIDCVEDLFECTAEEMAELFTEHASVLKSGVMGKKQREKLLREHAGGVGGGTSPVVSAAFPVTCTRRADAAIACHLTVSPSFSCGCVLSVHQGAAAAQEEMEAQRRQLTEQEEALRRQQSAVEKQAASLEAERAKVAAARLQAEEEAASLALARQLQEEEDRRRPPTPPPSAAPEPAPVAAAAAPAGGGASPAGSGGVVVATGPELAAAVADGAAVVAVKDGARIELTDTLRIAHSMVLAAESARSVPTIAGPMDQPVLEVGVSLERKGSAIEVRLEGLRVEGRNSSRSGDAIEARSANGALALRLARVEVVGNQLYANGSHKFTLDIALNDCVLRQSRGAAMYICGKQSSVTMRGGAIRDAATQGCWTYDGSGDMPRATVSSRSAPPIA